MLFELHQVRARPGRRADLVKVFEEEVIPFQMSKGVVIVGSWVGEQEDDLYVWIRRFDSEEERVNLYKAIYQSDHWKTVLGPHLAPLSDRESIVITRLNPTPHSVLR